jgi:ABC-2 type transport system ATP-binding protein
MTVSTHGLVKHYGAFTLSLPHLHIDAGQSVGLVGNNGAGKTTFLRLLLDLIAPDEGHVCIGGHAVNTDTTWKSFTGSYLDDSFLVDFLTPDEFIAFVGSVYRLSPDEQTERLAPFQSFYTDEPLGRTTKYLRDLSQGNRKKVGIIAAMFIQPRVLVLDEPFANLDPRSQLQLMRLLRQAQATHGTTLLISSHDLGHATDVCERIAVIEDGSLARDEFTTEDTLEALEQYFAEELRGGMEAASPNKNAAQPVAERRA